MRLTKHFRKHYLSLTCLLGLTLVTPGCSTKGKSDIVRTRFVHKYGIDVDQKDWTSRGSDGQIITTHADGVLVVETYEAGALHGKTTYTFPHSSIIAIERTYNKGVLTSEINHYLSGIPAEKIEFQEDHSVLKTSWYYNGQPKSIEVLHQEELITGQYFDLQNTVESKIEDGNGVRVQRDSYGELICKETFQEGRLTIATTYHPNGDPKTQTPFNDKGQIHGIRKSFLTEGVPHVFEGWKEGVQEGETILFQNGLKHACLPYVAGKRHGTEYVYKENNSIAEEISWKNDLRHGPSRVFVENATKTTWYFEGKLVSKLEYDQRKKM